MDNIFCALHFESLVNEAENKEHTFVLTIPCPILNKNFHVVPFVFFIKVISTVATASSCPPSCSISLFR
jgi:hypothetical protein